MARRGVAGVALAIALGCGGGDPPRSPVIAIAAGEAHTCALIDGGRIRCWGHNAYGQLGYGHIEPIGDDEDPYDSGDVDLGRPAVAIAAGGNHSCALLDDASVVCFGDNRFGQLGYGDVDFVGDDELPAARGPVPIGEPVEAIAVGGVHTCVLVAGGRVKCWGDATSGQLGHADERDIGDDEPASDGADVDVGGPALAVVAGWLHTCALLDAGAIRCWGRGEPPMADAPGGHGQLGYGSFADIGDDEAPSTAGDVPVGAPVASLAAGFFHQCAVVDGGALRCWGRGEGRNDYGQLGYPGGESLGDDEPASAGGDVDIGVAVDAAAAGDVHTCAITAGRRLRCWGFGGFGQLGYGNGDDIGDDEVPGAAGDVPVGEVVDVAAGRFHTCVVHPDRTVRCFGLGAVGSIGSGSAENLGDDEPAGAVPPILL